MLQENFNLAPYNTFGIEAFGRYYIEIDAIDDFLALLKTDVYRNNEKLILGGGSNILFTKNFDGLVVKNNLKGIAVVSETDTDALVKAAAGEVWHELVLFCIGMNYAGLENLSLIPGCVGASPMQNIGAYGVEIKDVFEELEAYDLKTGEKRIFKKDDCEFGYRESVFKHKYKNQYLITAVTFKLQKNAELNTSYGAINEQLKAMHIKHPDIRDVSNAIIHIRQSKLPDPSATGNAGSFFKNPEVSAQKHDALKEQFIDLVAYPLPNGHYKLAAGWLIERCGLKGYEHNGAAVHERQALVLVNKNHCTGKDVYDLSTHVAGKVFDTFGVTLEREVNIM